MTVIVPADAVETEKVIEFLADYEGPMYIRLGRSKVPMVHTQDYQFTLGKGTVLKPGKDVTVVAAGIMVSIALQSRIC